MKRFFRCANALLLFASLPLRADEGALSIHVLEQESASDFPPQLLVTYHNDSYLPFSLGEAMTKVELWVDSQPHALIRPFVGPAGVAGQGSWTGCLPWPHFQGMPASGKHRLQLRLGDLESNTAMSRRTPPRAKGTARTTLRDVKALARILPPGTPKSCVEFWFHQLDGGFQSADEKRYTLEPEVKLIVPYASSAPGTEAVVKGAIRVYNEKRFTD